MSTIDSDRYMLLIDGSAYIYRAFYAMPDLRSAGGEATGALYASMQLIQKLIKAYPSSHVAVIFDTATPSFRKEVDANYKSNRVAGPQSLYEQIPRLKDMLQAMGIRSIAMDHLEADDLIGVLSQKAKAQGMKVWIASPDKDMAQLVDADVKIIDPKTHRVLDRQAIFEKWNVWPEQIVDYLTLVGDASDHVRGVPGVGPKTAVRWLKVYSSLDHMYDHLDQLPSSLAQALDQGRDAIMKDRFLVTIQKDLHLDLSIDLFVRMPEQDEQLSKYRQKWSLSSPESSRLNQENAKSIHVHETSLHALFKSKKSTWNYLALLGDSSFSKRFLCAYCADKHSIEMIRIPHFHDDDLKALIDYLQDENQEKKWVCSKDWFCLAVQRGWSIHGVCHDVMLALHQERKYVGAFKPEDEMISSIKNQLKDQCSPAFIASVLQWFGYVWADLQNDYETFTLRYVKDIEIPMARILATMEHHGVLVNRDFLEQVSHDVKNLLCDVASDMHRYAGHSFNPLSSKQVAHVLFQELSLPAPKKISTDDEVLSRLAHPIAERIQTYRTLHKIQSSHIAVIQKNLSPHSRIHTTFLQTKTNTGRLSSIHPNMQNIPIRSEIGQKLRHAFIVPKGYYWIRADYSQIELRVMAHASQDAVMLEQFRQGQDIHAITAAMLDQIAIEDVTPHQRHRAKTVNFGVMYGMSAQGLSQLLQMDRLEAVRYLKRYDETYVGVRSYIDSIKSFWRLHGYVETMDGRKIYPPSGLKLSAVERAMINAPIQGSAADLMKRAMIDIDCVLRKKSLQSTITLQIHDELALESPAHEAEEVMHIVHQGMKHAASWSVPLDVVVHAQRCWGGN